MGNFKKLIFLYKRSVSLTWRSHHGVPVCPHDQDLVLLRAPGRAGDDGDDVGARHGLATGGHLE